MTRESSRHPGEDTSEFRTIGDCNDRCDKHRSSLYRYIDNRWMWILGAIASLAVIGGSVAWALKKEVTEVQIEQIGVKRDIQHTLEKVDDLHKHFLGKSK